MRKTVKFKMPEDAGRDAGKLFELTEMPASVGEKWAARALLALAKGGNDVPDEVLQSGMVGLATFALRGLTQLSWHDAEPLLEDMMQCVKIIRDPRHPEMTFPLAMEDDIEEIQTYVRLRAEVFKLHTDFFLQGSGRAEHSPTTSRSAAPSATSTSHNPLPQ